MRVVAAPKVFPLCYQPWRVYSAHSGGYFGTTYFFQHSTQFDAMRASARDNSFTYSASWMRTSFSEWD